MNETWKVVKLTGAKNVPFLNCQIFTCDTPHRLTTTWFDYKFSFELGNSQRS